MPPLTMPAIAATSCRHCLAERDLVPLDVGHLSPWQDPNGLGGQLDPGGRAEAEAREIVVQPLLVQLPGQQRGPDVGGLGDHATHREAEHAVLVVVLDDQRPGAEPGRNLDSGGGGDRAGISECG
jgi:hypothetical protein